MLRGNRFFRMTALALGTAFVAGSGAPARAAGFAIFEAGSKATGMAGAFVATASDPSAMFYNPAGLGSNEKMTAMVGATIIIPRTTFEGADPYPGSGYTEDLKAQIFFPPNFYVAVPIIPKKLNVSLGTWFPFGLSTAWENPDTFRGRFISQRVDLRQYSLGLQLSWAATDWLSLGAGPELRIGDVKLQRNVPLFNPFTARVVDAAHVDIVSNGFATDLSWGAGILLKPTDCVRLGASYHAAVDQKYKGDAVFYQMSTGNPQLDAVFASRIPVNVPVPVETTIQYPAVTQVGVSVDFLENLTLEAAATYTQWDVFTETVLAFGTVDNKSPGTSTIPHNWKNAWAYRFGGNLQATPTFNVNLGFVYDQTPQPDEDMGPLLPDANRTGYTVGLGFKMGKYSVLELSNMFLFFHRRETLTNHDNFNGLYKTFANLTVFNFRTSF